MTISIHVCTSLPTHDEIPSLRNLGLEFADRAHADQALALLGIGEHHLFELHDDTLPRRERAIHISASLAHFNHIAAGLPGSDLWKCDQGRRFLHKAQPLGFAFSGYTVTFAGCNSTSYQRVPTVCTLNVTITAPDGSSATAELGTFVSATGARQGKAFATTFADATRAWQALLPRERPAPACSRLLDQLLEHAAEVLAFGAAVTASYSPTLQPEDDYPELEKLAKYLRIFAEKRAAPATDPWPDLDSACAYVPAYIDRQALASALRSRYPSQDAFLTRKPSCYYAPWEGNGALAISGKERLSLYFAEPCAIGDLPRLGALLAVAATPEPLLALATLDRRRAFEIQFPGGRVCHRSEEMAALMDGPEGSDAWAAARYEEIAASYGCHHFGVFGGKHLIALASPNRHRPSEPASLELCQVAGDGAWTLVGFGTLVSASGARLVKSFCRAVAITPEEATPLIERLIALKSRFHQEITRVGNTTPTQGAASPEATVGAMVRAFLAAGPRADTAGHHFCCTGDLTITRLALERVHSVTPLSPQQQAALLATACDCQVATAFGG